VRFVDFLRTTVLLSAAAATALATITVLAGASASNSLLVPLAVAWWLIAVVIGLWQGKRAQTTPPIARLLSGAKATTTLPEHHPSAVLLNRLWPLLLFTLLSGGLAFLAPQIPGIAAGFAIIWALAWRRQDAAVEAIEERDGACFYVRRTSPVRPMALDRTPGFKAARPERANGAVT
jgi:small-conductance mechanosensitive channel